MIKNNTTFLTTLLKKGMMNDEENSDAHYGAFGGYAAALIQEAGLKGFRIGDAAISEKHSGFAVNLGNATATDVKQLLIAVSQKVYEMSGIRIEPEVRIWE